MSIENTFYQELKTEDILWSNLMHWNGSADDIPVLLKIIQEDDTAKSRMALLTIAGCIEKDQKVITATPVVLIFLCRLLIVKPANQDLILRILLKVSQAVGASWSSFYSDKELYQLKNIDVLWKQSDVLIKGRIKETEREQCLQKYVWYYCVNVFSAYKSTLEKVVAKDGIEQGFIYQILTIIKMIKPQRRQILGENRRWESSRLTFIPISEKYQIDLRKNLTPEVTKYLSFDILSNPLFTKLYIQSSEAEYARGTAVVLVVKDKETDEFLGSCGIHDINEESAELGLWLKREAQGKGVGVEIIQTLLKIVENECDVRYAVYSVEKDNYASQMIANKAGFKKTIDFILEPTALKSRMREMIQYKLELA